MKQKRKYVLDPNERTLRKARILTHPGYNPARLLNEVAWRIGSQSDDETARRLGFDRGQISRVRNRKDLIGARLMICIMDMTGMSLPELREIAGMPVELELGEPAKKAA